MADFQQIYVSFSWCVLKSRWELDYIKHKNFIPNYESDEINNKIINLLIIDSCLMTSVFNSCRTIYELLNC